MSMRGMSWLCIVAVSGVPATMAMADERIDQLQEELRELRRAIVVRDDVIRHLIDRLDELESHLHPSAPGPAQIREPDPQQEALEQAVQEAAEEERREQERLIRAAFEQTLIDRGGLLLPPGTFEADLGFSYISSSSDRIVIDGFTILPVLVVGDIVNERVRTDIAQTTFTGRIGLPEDWQLEARIPWGWQRRQVVTAENEESTQSAQGLGDIELALSHQLIRGSERWPDLLGSLRWKTTTGNNPFDQELGRQLSLGSGFNSYAGSLTVVHVTDPAVFFGGLSYTYNEGVDIEAGRFRSGNTVGAQVGLALALNLDTSISFGFSQQLSASSRIDDARIPGSSLVTSSFNVGASYSMSPDFTVDFGLGIGVTADSPDLQFTVGMPLRLRQ
ncbi:hypothetical protein ECTOBSL9_3108 [Ectothiorhodospira sp. BSL-9]|nr:hypothetical protein ECTOBSL9_3108 [Ectothiorhodospira sp. BSL-9]